MWCICRVKRIVHLKIEIWCLSAYPKDIQDVGNFVSTIEHKLRFLTQSVTVCQSWQSMGALRETKTCTDKTKLNPAARDDTLKSKDKERLVCARSWTVFIYIFFTSDPLHWYRHEPLGLIWFCLCMFFSLSKPWVPLTAIIWLTECNGLS